MSCTQHKFNKPRIKLFCQESIQKSVALLPRKKQTTQCKEELWHQFPSESQLTACDDSSIGEEESRCSEIDEFSFSDDNEAHADEQRYNNRVSFSDVEVRLYHIELGDNPAVSSGPPISISWDYFQKYNVSIDYFEANKPSQKPLVALEPLDRIQLLVEAGYSLTEIRDKYDEIEMIKRKREKSNTKQEFSPILVTMKSLLKVTNHSLTTAA